jgi:hypothetical protein
MSYDFDMPAFAVMKEGDTVKEAVSLFTTEEAAREALEGGGELVELNEYAARRILAALRDLRELEETLRTGLGRRARGTR